MSVGCQANKQKGVNIISGGTSQKFQYAYKYLGFTFKRKKRFL